MLSGQSSSSLRCPRDPLRRSAWWRCKKLEVFCVFDILRMNPLRRSCVSKRSRCGAVRILLSLGEPSAEIVRVEALSLWRRAILLFAKWPLEVVSWFARLLSQSRGRGFEFPLVRGSSSLKIAAFNVVRGACSCSSGWKIASFENRRSMRRVLPQRRLTFQYKRSTRSTLPQLRLENRNF